MRVRVRRIEGGGGEGTYGADGVEAFEMSPEFGFGTGASGGIDGQRQLQQRIAAVLEVVVGQGLDSGQGFQDTDDGRFVEAEQVLPVDELREEAHQSFRPTQLLDGAQHLLPNALACPVLYQLINQSINQSIHPSIHPSILPSTK